MQLYRWVQYLKASSTFSVSLWYNTRWRKMIRDFCYHHEIWSFWMYRLRWHSRELECIKRWFKELFPYRRNFIWFFSPRFTVKEIVTVFWSVCDLMALCIIEQKRLLLERNDIGVSIPVPPSDMIMVVLF